MTSKDLIGDLRKCVVSIERLDVSKFLDVSDQKENDIVAEDSNDSEYGSDSSFEELGIDKALQNIHRSLPPGPSDFSTEKRNEKKNLSNFNSQKHKKATNTASGASKQDSQGNTSKDAHISRKGNREHLSGLKKTDQAESAVAKKIMHDHDQNSNTKSVKKNSGKEIKKSHDVTVKEKHTYKYFDYDFDMTDDATSESDESNYEMNLVSEAARQIILCPKCKENFSNIHNLFKHTCDGKTQEGFLCKFCDKMFKEHEKLIAHSSSHISKYFRCKFCRIKFKHRNSYAYHMKTFHPECLLFPCMFYTCNKSFSKQIELKRHFITHKKFVCFVCFERFGKNHKLHEHVVSCHK